MQFLQLQSTMACWTKTTTDFFPHGFWCVLTFLIISITIYFYMKTIWTRKAGFSDGFWHFEWLWFSFPLQINFKNITWTKPKFRSTIKKKKKNSDATEMNTGNVQNPSEKYIINLQVKKGLKLQQAVHVPLTKKNFTNWNEQWT